MILAPGPGHEGQATPLRRALTATAIVASLATSSVSCAAEPENRTAPVPDNASPSQLAPGPTRAPRPTEEPLRITVVGDSNSTGFSGTLEDGIAAQTSWVAHLPADQFTLVDGWAIDGATTTAMADAAASLSAGDVLVVMGGTNDLALGASGDSVLAELRRTADAVGAPVVAVGALAPYDFLPEEVTAFNARLERFADEQGWVFIDPWRAVRSSDGTWVGAYRTDGIHTSPEGYAEAGSQIARQLAIALGD